MNQLEINNIINNGDLKLYAGEKRQNNDDKYYLIRLSIKDNDNGDKLIEDLKKNHLINSLIISEQDILEYNPIINQNDVIEKIKTDETSGYNELILKTNNIDTSSNINPKKIKFYLFEYNLNNSKVYIVRRNFNTMSLKKSVFVKLAPDGIYDIIDVDGSLKIDYDIDLIIYNNYIYINNHISLERIFYLNEEFKEKASIILDRIEETNKIKDFDKIKNKLLDNGRFVRRIAKLSEDNDRSTLFLESIDKTKIAINKFELPIIYNEAKNHFEVNYKDSVQLNILVNLMQDSYYETIIGEDRGEDHFR